VPGNNSRPLPVFAPLFFYTSPKWVNFVASPSRAFILNEVQLFFSPFSVAVVEFLFFPSPQVAKATFLTLLFPLVKGTHGLVLPLALPFKKGTLSNVFSSSAGDAFLPPLKHRPTPFFLQTCPPLNADLARSRHGEIRRRLLNVRRRSLSFPSLFPSSEEDFPPVVSLVKLGLPPLFP